MNAPPARPPDENDCAPSGGTDEARGTEKQRNVKSTASPRALPFEVVIVGARDQRPKLWDVYRTAEAADAVVSLLRQHGFNAVRRDDGSAP
jgi:hypothetical protein